MTDTELFEKCKKRNRRAWDIFVRRYREHVRKSITYKFYKMDLRIPHSEISDIVQEVFLLIWEQDKLKNVKHPSNIGHWLALTAINASISYCRKHLFSSMNRSYSLDSVTLENNTQAPLAEILPSSKFNTSKEINKNEIFQIFEKELTKLNHKNRLALKFNIYDGRTQKEIAQIMNLPINTVSTMIKRSKDRIKKQLKKVLDK